MSSVSDSVTDRGVGSPTLVFVHGFGCAHTDWDSQIDVFSNRHRCVALDLPGHGTSPAPQKISVSGLAEAVTGLRETLGLGEVVLIGHSLGAKIVREAYAQKSEGVAGIVLIDGSHYEGERDALVQRATALTAENFDTFMRKMFEAMFLDTADPAVVEQMVSRAESMNTAFRRALFLATVGWDPERGIDSIRTIKTPLLVIQSTYFDADFVRRPLPAHGHCHFTDLVQQLQPNAQIRVATQSGHFSMLDAPTQVNTFLREFEESLPGRSSAHCVTCI